MVVNDVEIQKIIECRHIEIQGVKDSECSVKSWFNIVTTQPLLLPFQTDFTVKPMCKIAEDEFKSVFTLMLFCKAISKGFFMSMCILLGLNLKLAS